MTVQCNVSLPDLVKQLYKDDEKQYKVLIKLYDEYKQQRMKLIYTFNYINLTFIHIKTKELLQKKRQEEEKAKKIQEEEQQFKKQKGIYISIYCRNKYKYKK